MTTCWVLTDGKMGCRRQALGLAKALGWSFEEKTASRRKPWYWLPPTWHWQALQQLENGSSTLQAPWPDWIISCGFRSIPISLAIRHASGGRSRCIHVQNPRVHPKHFDWVFAATHDSLAGPNVITHTGALHDITSESIQAACDQNQAHIQSLKAPCCAVIIGGDTKQYRMQDADIDATAAKLQSLQKQWPGTLIFLTSRRTPDRLIEHVNTTCRDHPHAVHFDQQIPNGYLTALGVADTLMVTNDSSSMISECCSTGKPVYILPLPGFKNKSKINLLINTLIQQGMCRWYQQELASWHYQPLQESQRVAAVFGEKIKLAQAEPSC